MSLVTAKNLHYVYLQSQPEFYSIPDLVNVHDMF